MRIALDPSTWDYYAAGLVLGAFVFDLLATRWRIPWTTLVAFVFVAESHELITTDSLRAWTRAVAVLAICAVVLAIKMMGRRTDADVVALPDGHNQW
jgi:hypothetical protein